MGININAISMNEDSAYKTQKFKESENKYKWVYTSENTFGCMFKESSYRFNDKISALKDGLINYLENINPTELTIKWKNDLIQID